MDKGNVYLKKRIVINGISSLLQVGITSITYFFLYKYLLNYLGADQLGLWSLIIASTSIASIGSFGVSGSAVKFIAGYTAKKENDKVVEIIYTGSLVTAGFILIFSVIAYGIISMLLKSLVSPATLNTAYLLLPYAFISLITNTIASMFLSTIDGLQLIYVKNIVLSFFSILFLVCAFLFVPHFKILGVAYAQAIQSGGTLIASIILVSYNVSDFSIFRWKFSKSAFKELFSYGMKLQFMSISAMLFDPVTKFFLTKFAGLGIVGFYEMANKLVLQLRSLIITSSQVMVPAIAGLTELGTLNVKKVYKQMFEVMSLSSIILITYISAFATYISIIWIGRPEKDFVISLSLICAGWFFNIISAPAFFINLATGKLKWNLISQLSIGILNCIFCFFLGIAFGKFYIIAGSALALIISALMLIYFFNKDYNIKVGELFDRYFVTILIASLVIILGTNYIFYHVNGLVPVYILFACSFLAATVIMFILFLNHPIKDKYIEMGKSILKRN
jgi:O-antigen/teichoic acid export membrane protein